MPLACNTLYIEDRGWKKIQMEAAKTCHLSILFLVASDGRFPFETGE